MSIRKRESRKGCVSRTIEFVLVRTIEFVLVLSIRKKRVRGRPPYKVDGFRLDSGKGRRGEISFRERGISAEAAFCKALLTKTFPIGRRM